MPLAMKHRAVLAAARAAGSLSRALGRGAGDTLPGRIVDRLAPDLPSSLAAALTDGCILVSGTNGKTTTASMIAAIARASGLDVAANKSGSNMQSGVISTLMDARGCTVGVFEVDEVALPKVVAFTRPRALVLTNIFRDQLDRFGEPEKVASLFAEAAALLPDDARIVFNADEPLLSAQGWPRPTTTFAIRVEESQAGSAGGEPELCPRCGHQLDARARTFAQLGAFGCAACGWASPEPGLIARVTERNGLDAITLDVGGERVALQIGGAFNAYNAAAALATADLLGVQRSAAVAALEAFRPRFGRLERLAVDGRDVVVTLMKNPAGADAILADATAASIGALVIAVNDQAADGRDVSWIWDAGFEVLRARGVPVFAAGRRAEEVALRLDYAGVEAAGVDRHVIAAVRTAQRTSPATVCVLATYTAMLELRAAVLGKTGWVSDA